MNRICVTRALFALTMYASASYQAFCALPLAFPSAEGATVGISIVRLSDGHVVADYDSERLMIPASVLKCVTAATAQLTLPEGFAFATRLAMCGVLHGDGTLDGPVAIVGGYDPTLGSRFLADSVPFVDWAVERLAECGVRRVVGDVLSLPGEPPADAVSPRWMLEDVEWEYGAGCFPINFRDNSYELGGERMSDASPGATLCEALAAALESREIAVDWTFDTFADGDSLAEASLAGTRTWTYLSPRRDEVMRIMMHRSDNLYAEAMLRAPLLHEAGAQRRGCLPMAVVADSALAMQRRVWSKRGVDLARGRVVDGCGLSPVNRLSPRMLCDVLRSMAGESDYAALFPVAGRDGTVKSFLRSTPLAGRMALKSGSMTGVQCYAGYRLGGDGRPTHAVVVMVNGFTCPAARVREAISAYLVGKLK